MYWMRAYPLRGETGGGWALEFESIMGPVKWHRADRRIWGPKNCAQDCINHRCIGCFMHTSPLVTLYDW
jgi:hypothetical protein